MLRSADRHQAAKSVDVDDCFATAPNYGMPGHGCGPALVQWQAVLLVSSTPLAVAQGRLSSFTHPQCFVAVDLDAETTAFGPGPLYGITLG